MKRFTFAGLRKHAAALATALLLAGALLPLSQPALAAPPTATVFIRGDKLATAPVLSEEKGVTYVPLRAFALAMDPQAEVIWDKEKKQARVSAGGLTLEVTVGEQYIVANGRYLYLPEPSSTSEGRILLPVRVLAKAYGAEVRWDGTRREVYVEAAGEPIESGDTFYDETELYWLSRIISAESKGESLEGQIAVGNVVLNRLANDYWPQSVYDVIFDTRCGVQFTPTANGTVYKEPAESSVIAAKLALDGANTAGDSLFFLNEAIATSKWITENCEFVKTIGNHSFYTKDV